MKKYFVILFASTILNVPLNVLNAQTGVGASAQQYKLVDPQATKETVNLFKNLNRLRSKGIMFAHQDDLAYGVGWKYEPGRSDIKDVTGDYPAVYGWELGHLELDSAVNLDGVPFGSMQKFIREAYDRGGVITISWHLRNPLTGKTAWNPAPGTVTSILPGGEKNELYKRWLDKLTGFLSALKGSKGEYIPVIFRPFHELNGSWFWWGKDHCSPAELKSLWEFTVSYLRDKKSLHHLLYAFNTDKFSSQEEYLERYPGDAWVDVIGFDVYQRGKGDSANRQFIAQVQNMLGVLELLATTKQKIPAITEFGFGQVPDSLWWTNTLWKAVSGHKIAYMLAWRNAGAKAGGFSEFYVPYKSHASAANFVEFYKLPGTFFQKDISRESIYK